MALTSPTADRRGDGNGRGHGVRQHRRRRRQFLLDDNTPLGAEDTTSPYSVSWNTTTATNGQHTLAAQARDAAGNMTTASKTVTVDNQAPTGTVAINGGAAATNNTHRDLTLSATDALRRHADALLQHGTSFSAAEAYAHDQDLDAHDRRRHQDRLRPVPGCGRNWSTAATDTIVLDTTAPTVSGRTATNITGNSATSPGPPTSPRPRRVDYGPTTSYGSTTPLDPSW